MTTQSRAEDAIHPDIRASFHAVPGGYVSRSEGGPISCPPYVIASAAADRAPEDALDLPAGYDLDVLDQIRFATGFTGQDTHISPRQAAELAQIGARLLTLNAEGRIDPPLRYFEQQSIGHLVKEVGSS